MPDYLTDAEIWKALWPLILFPLACALLICLSLAAKPYSGSLAPVFALSLLGMVTGLLTGLSRDPAVGAVLPAILGLIGGMTIYLIGTKGAQLQSVAMMGVIGLALNLLVGVYWGAHSRAVYELASKSPEALAAKAVAEEDARYTASLRRLLNDQEYTKSKADLEAEGSR
jgi:hypothetical protein